MADVPVYLTTKRKRGRPRKDGNLYRDSLQSPVNNPNVGKKLNLYNNNDNPFEGIVGKTVYGVIEGSFDAGYLISVKTANSCIPFRGVVFHSEKVIPLTPGNDIAPKAKMHPRREISVPLYNAQTHFNNSAPISPISPCGSNTSVTQYAYGSRAFSVPGATVSRIVSCPNLQGNGTKQGVSRLGVKNVGILEHDEFIFGANVNRMATAGDMSGSSYNTAFSGFMGNGVNSEHGSSMLTQNNLQGSNIDLNSNFMVNSPRPAFGTQQNGMIVNRSGWQREPQAIQSDMGLKDLYHGEMNNLDLNFHQNLFSNQSQHGTQDQAGTNFHQVDFVNDNSRCQSMNSPIASVMEEKKSLQEPDRSEACVETSYLATNEFKSPNPFWQSLHDGNNLTTVENNGRYTNEDAGSLPEGGSVFNLDTASTQSELERKPGKQKTSSAVSIADFDYVMSDVVPSSESLSFHSQLGEQQVINDHEANGFQFLWKQ